MEDLLSLIIFSHILPNRTTPVLSITPAADARDPGLREYITNEGRPQAAVQSSMHLPAQEIRASAWPYRGGRLLNTPISATYHTLCLCRIKFVHGWTYLPETSRITPYASTSGCCARQQGIHEGGFFL
jgi:hypothetical protein